MEKRVNRIVELINKFGSFEWGLVSALFLALSTIGYIAGIRFSNSEDLTMVAGIGGMIVWWCAWTIAISVRFAPIATPLRKVPLKLPAALGLAVTVTITLSYAFFGMYWGEKITFFTLVAMLLFQGWRLYQLGRT